VAIQKGDIDLLESVQHRATRIIPSLKKISYENRLKALDLTTLSERRQLLLLLLLILGYIRVP